MREYVGNIWTWWESGAHVVVPVNIGYKKDGENVMGRGVALQAARRWPEILKEWGAICKRDGSMAAVTLCKKRRLIYFPTKPLDTRQPWASWKGEAKLALIERSAGELAEVGKHIAGTIAVPLVGCGNGKLKEEDVLPILHAKLTDDRFALVRTFKSRGNVR